MYLVQNFLFAESVLNKMEEIGIKVFKNQFIPLLVSNLELKMGGVEPEY